MKKITIVAVISILCMSTVVMGEQVTITADKIITQQRKIELNGAKSVIATLDANMAGISVHDGTSEFLDGKFIYTNPSLKPDFNYTVNQGIGELTLRQPELKNIKGEDRNYWILAFNQSVPIDLSAKSSFGDVNLNLSKLNMTCLKANTSSGDITLDLSGDQNQLSSINLGAQFGDVWAGLKGSFDSLSNINMSLSSGQSTLNLAGDYKKLSTIDIRGQFGDIWTGLDGKYNILSNISLTSSSGDTTIKLPGDYQKLSSLDIHSQFGDVCATLKGHYFSSANINLMSSSGDTSVDLTGNWEKDAAVTVTSAFGDVTVKVPNKVGVHAVVNTKLGDVSASGLSSSDGAFINTAYGHAKVTLNISVESSSGDVKLMTGD